MATVLSPGEIVHLDTLPLKDHSDILPKLRERRETRLESMYHDSAATRCHNLRLKSVVKYLILFLLLVGIIVAITITQIDKDSTLESLASATSNKLTASSQSDQPCSGSESKQSFADLDYALLGYNILKGFPLAVGHDPGFTLPIFKADYSSGRQTADCRFAVPNGLVVIPDVSCITSFSSTTMRSKYEFSRAIRSYTKVSVGGWGNSFSASVGYKGSSAEMSSGEYVFILSSAKCNYYFSKLVTDNAPDFDEVFASWIHKLNGAGSDTELYFRFFETYGTHFATEVTFGARYTYEYKMSSSYYESERKHKVDVKVLASTSGLFGSWRAKGESEFSLDQKKKMSNFRENVETKTTTVGAQPPEEGGALAWASTVKTDPVPTMYKLSSIEDLFTDKYMKSYGVDYKRINKNIVSYKLEYCLFLQKKGEVESCEEIVAGIELKNTRILGHYQEKAVSSISDCIDICLEDVDCEAVSFCTTCTSKDTDHNTCFLLQSNFKNMTAKKTENPGHVWQSNVLPGKINTQLQLRNTNVIGVPRGFENEEDKTADLNKCKELCILDAYCTAYSYCNCNDQVSKCKMYSTVNMLGLQPETYTDTFFISASNSTQ